MCLIPKIRAFVPEIPIASMAKIMPRYENRGIFFVNTSIKRRMPYFIRGISNKLKGFNTRLLLYFYHVQVDTYY